MSYPILYEINTRCWLGQLSRRHGFEITLPTVPDSEFARWSGLGFTHIWLMGVWRTGPRSRAESMRFLEVERASMRSAGEMEEIGIVGSPYAVAEYSVSEALGGESGLQTFRRRLHERGLKLVLDFVPNHVGLDHGWVTERPELFVQSRAESPGFFAQKTKAGARWLAHGRDPYFPAWSDTAQLDYRRKDAREEMRSLLLEIAGRCDGVRCDMAMLLLRDVFERTWKDFSVVPPADESSVEFWEDAVARVKAAHPEMLFLAEVYWGLEERLQSLGFDYTYDKVLYDRIIGRDWVGVQEHLLGSKPEWVQASAHFLENHDEPRIASLLGLEEHRAAALLILSLPGMRLLHEGQLGGARVRIPVQWCSCVTEPVVPGIERMYEELLRALEVTAVGRGAGRILKAREAWQGNPTAQHFVLIQWQAETQGFDLAVINLAAHRSQCYAELSIANLAGKDWVMKDVLGAEEHKYSGQDLAGRGLYLDLPGTGAQLFHFKAQSIS